MSNEVTTPLDEERAALVTEWINLAEQIDPALKRIADIKARLEELPVGTQAVPGIPQRVQVTQAQTFKPDKFLAKYPPTDRANLPYYALVPNAAKAKDLLSPADYKACTAPAKKSVKLV